MEVQLLQVGQRMGPHSRPQEIRLISLGHMDLISDIKLIRTDTTLDLSQKAEKVCQMERHESPLGTHVVVGHKKKQGGCGFFCWRTRANHRQRFLQGCPVMEVELVKRNGGWCASAANPPLPKILLCARGTSPLALPGHKAKCKAKHPNSRTACLITAATQPGMLQDL